MVTGGGGERAPDSATIMTTTTISVARMDMFRLVWLFLTNVLRLVLDVYERLSKFGLPVEKGNRVYGSSFSARAVLLGMKAQLRIDYGDICLLETWLTLASRC